MINSLFGWLLTSLVAGLHPFFVSVIEVNHNAKDKTVEVSVRIFVDDLEAVLKKQSNTSIDLTKATDKAKNDKLIAQYIQNKMQLKADGKIVALNYVGFEIQQESAWCFFEAANFSSIKKIEVNCSLLYEWQSQQMNIFHVKVNGIEKSYKLDNPKTQTEFTF